MTSSRLDTVVCIAISLILVLAYGFSMPGVVTFEDAGLFLEVCEFNGIAHPPGYPLFTLVCVPWFQMPFDPVILGNSLSALFAVLTCLVVYHLVRKTGLGVPVAFSAAVLLGLSRDFWAQSIVIEVYTLNTLLVAIAIYLAICFKERPKRRYLVLLVLTLSFGLSNHWPLVLLSCPGLLIICLARHEALLMLARSPVTWLLCCLAVVIGLSPYLVLLLKPDPVFSYSGPINTLTSFVAYVAREAYQGVDQSATETLQDKIQFLFWLLEQAARQYGLFFGFIAIVGLTAGLVANRFLFAGLAVIVAGNTILLVWLLGFEFDFIHQAVFRPYPLVAWLCLAVLIAEGLTVIGRTVKGWPRSKIVFVAGMMLIVVVTNAGWNDRHKDTLANDYARFLLTSLKPEASLVVTSDPQIGPISYLHQVAGVRPDVNLYEAENLFLGEKLPRGDVALKQRFVDTLSPLYSVGIPWLPTGVDYGLFLEHVSPVAEKTAGSGVLPGLDKLVNPLVKRFLDKDIKDPNTLYFAHQLLLALGGNLTTYAFTQRIKESEVTILRLVQATFPGMLASMSTILANPAYPMPDNVLLATALPFDGRFGHETPDREIASYYYMMAYILAFPDETLIRDPLAALGFLDQGAALVPGRGNPGFCLRVALRAELDLQPAIEAQSDCNVP